MKTIDSLMQERDDCENDLVNCQVERDEHYVERVRLEAQVAAFRAYYEAAEALIWLEDRRTQSHAEVYATYAPKRDAVRRIMGEA
jgi:hypothetical protein